LKVIIGNGFRRRGFTLIEVLRRDFPGETGEKTQKPQDIGCVCKAANWPPAAHVIREVQH